MEHILKLITEECDAVKELLLKKNVAYGSSFAYPINIFSKTSAAEQINVRIDDKLNRIAKGQNKEEVPEDTEIDLIGYLVLKRVVRKLNAAQVIDPKSLEWPMKEVEELINI